MWILCTARSNSNGQFPSNEVLPFEHDTLSSQIGTFASDVYLKLSQTVISFIIIMEDDINHDSFDGISFSTIPPTVISILYIYILIEWKPRWISVSLEIRYRFDFTLLWDYCANMFATRTSFAYFIPFLVYQSI